MPLNSGRKKDPHWLEVEDVENDPNKVVCKHCETLISKKIERVREHIKKCKKLTKKHVDDGADEELEKLAQYINERKEIIERNKICD